MELEFVDFLKITPNHAALYSRPINGYPRSLKQEKTKENLNNPSYNARGLSFNSAKKIKESCRSLLFLTQQKYISHLAKHKKKEAEKKYSKVVFITLTLPAKQIESDNDIKKKYLNQFLIEMQRYCLVDLYVWRAEKQKNGNIHFHIIVNKNIHWAWVRRTWNRILSKGENNYISRFSQKMQDFFKDGFKMQYDGRSEQKQREVYNREKKNKWTNPNSTDLKLIENEKALNNYISKYLSKNNNNDDDSQKVTGKIWGCSREISCCNPATIVLQEVRSSKNEHYKAIFEELEASEKKVIEEEGYKVTLFFKGKSWRYLLELLKDKYLNCLSSSGYLAQEYQKKYEYVY